MEKFIEIMQKTTLKHIDTTFELQDFATISVVAKMVGGIERTIKIISNGCSITNIVTNNDGIELYKKTNDDIISISKGVKNSSEINYIIDNKVFMCEDDDDEEYELVHNAIDSHLQKVQNNNYTKEQMEHTKKEVNLHFNTLNTLKYEIINIDVKYKSNQLNDLVLVS